MDATLWALGRGTGVSALVLLTVALLLGVLTRAGRPAMYNCVLDWASVTIGHASIAGRSQACLSSITASVGEMAFSSARAFAAASRTSNTSVTKPPTSRVMSRTAPVRIVAMWPTVFAPTRSALERRPCGVRTSRPSRNGPSRSAAALSGRR